MVRMGRKMGAAPKRAALEKPPGTKKENFKNEEENEHFKNGEENGKGGVKGGHVSGRRRDPGRPQGGARRIRV